MPIYMCPKCGRQVELVEGKYYCKVCGPSAIMIELSTSSDKKTSHMEPKLGVYETLALKWLQEFWEQYPEPIVTVHTAFGLARRSYGTKYARSAEFWQKILEELEKKGLVEKIQLHKYGPVFWKVKRFSASGEHSTIEKEVERARALALMRRRGVVEPVTWLDVFSAFQEHYRKVKDALIKAVGGYDNIEHIREYPAEPFEAYYKIRIMLKNPVTAEFKLLDSDVLMFNGQPLPLYIDEKAYTPYRLRLYKFFMPDPEELQRKIEGEKYVKMTIQDFYVQVDNPAWYERFEAKIVPRPGIFGFSIYK